MILTRVSRSDGFETELSSLDEVAQEIIRIARELEIPAKNVFDALKNGESIRTSGAFYSANAFDLVCELAEDVSA